MLSAYALYISRLPFGTLTLISSSFSRYFALYELIEAAHSYYLDKWYNEDKKLEENPNDIIAQCKVKEYWKIQKRTT